MEQRDLDILKLLGEYVTDNKKLQIEKVLDERTNHITVVLEDVYHSQNASAVVRTCDGFGLQNLHIVENKYAYKINPNVVRGASKWIDISLYNKLNNSTSVTCLKELKKKGYKIVATSLDPDCLSINDLDVDEKIALVFGTELTGVRNETMEMADEKVTIPMYGFTESFNISVSAAICLNVLVGKLKHSEVNWRLSDNEKQAIRLEWHKKIVKRSDLHIKNYLQTVLSK